MRWTATLACSAARAFAASVLDLRVGGGPDGDVPRGHVVANDFRQAFFLFVFLRKCVTDLHSAVR